jgi:hypothetical protein
MVTVARQHAPLVSVTLRELRGRNLRERRNGQKKTEDHAAALPQTLLIMRGLYRPPSLSRRSSGTIARPPRRPAVRQVPARALDRRLTARPIVESLGERESDVNAARTLPILVLSYHLDAVSVGAHHSWNTVFSEDKPLVLKGTISKVELVNPHAWIWIAVKARTARSAKWGIEADRRMA